MVKIFLKKLLTKWSSVTNMFTILYSYMQLTQGGKYESYTSSSDKYKGFILKN
jgi:hypothetical protein